MNDCCIREMIKVLGPVISPKKREEAIKILESYWSDKIAAVWTVGDIISRAEDLGYSLAPNKAVDILDDAFQNHDADIGLCWAVFDDDIRDRGVLMTKEQGVLNVVEKEKVENDSQV